MFDDLRKGQASFLSSR